MELQNSDIPSEATETPDTPPSTNEEITPTRRIEDPLPPPNTLGRQEKQPFLKTELMSVVSDQGLSRRALFFAWWLELASLLLAIAAFIAIAITLYKYNQQEQPAWRYSINLNTLVAILSTVLRACMVVVVEEGNALLFKHNFVTLLKYSWSLVVSQLKWMWFHKPRPIRHLAYFDTAAHGPWASLVLGFRIKRMFVRFFRF
jgi:hypothetical protein